MPLIPRIDYELKCDLGTAVTQLVTFLEPTRQPWTSLEQRFADFLRTALDAFDIAVGDGFGTAHILQPDGRTLRRVATYGIFDDSLLTDQSVTDGIGVVSWVAARAQPVLINDLTRPGCRFNDIYVRHSANIKSELAVPMMDGSHVLGVLNLECVERNKFTNLDVGLLLQAATQATAAIMLEQKAKTAQDQEAATSGLLHFFARVPELALSKLEDRPLDQFAMAAQQALKTSGCDLWVHDDASGSFTCVGVTYRDYDSSRRPRPEGHGWTDWIRRNRQAVWISLDDASGAK